MPEIKKRWDAAKGRMTLLLTNGKETSPEITVEDTYPEGISGVLCFAKSGGALPAATASCGRIVWKVPPMAPGEVRELVYTSIPRTALADPQAKKSPTKADAGLFVGMANVSPVIKEETIEAEWQPVATIQPACMKRDGRNAAVISIGAGKGGTGKTTFSINLAAALSSLGFDTVLLDADASMGDLASYLGLTADKATLHDVLAGEALPEDASYPVFNDHLRAVPCGPSIDGFLKMDRDLLGDAIDHYAMGAGFVIIDTPAGYNKEVALSLKSSDRLILVLNPDLGSMTDGIKLQEIARMLRVDIMGIVLNRYDIKAPQYTRAQIEEYFGTPVIAMLPDDPEARRPDKVPAVIASPGSKISEEVYRVAGSISGKRRAPPEVPSLTKKLIQSLFK